MGTRRIGLIGLQSSSSPLCQKIKNIFCCQITFLFIFSIREIFCALHNIFNILKKSLMGHILHDLKYSTGAYV